MLTINSTSVFTNVKADKTLQRQSYSPTISNNIQDTVSIKNNLIAFGSKGNKMYVVNPEPLANPISFDRPAIQMRVTGVTRHQIEDEELMGDAPQRAIKQKGGKPRDNTINKLADANWKDGQPVYFQFDFKTKKLLLKLPQLGEIGRVPDEFSHDIEKLIDRHGKENFKFELSNVVAGTTKGASTIGLRVNLIYTGTSQSAKKEVQDVFNYILNNKENKEKVMCYQPETSPQEILKLILDNEAKTKSPKAAARVETVIQNIVKEIESPANKRILLVGHCKPDGDTLGCILGLKNAINFSNPEKVVDASVDDKIPGLFRHKMPGIDDAIKRPSVPARIGELKGLIKQIKQSGPTMHSETQVQILEKEIEDLSNEKNLLKPEDKYDLVVLMDIPTPKRFTDKYKQYMDSAKKVIFIDHHPQRIDEWIEDKDKTGVDMDKIHENNLDLVVDSVPAATQLVGVVASKLHKLKGMMMEKNSQRYMSLPIEKKDQFNAFIAATVTGMSTDTGSFLRTANLLPEHEKMPVSQRPNFLPEGMSKFLMRLTNGRIDKKWLREEISYDLTDEKPVDMGVSARDRMITVSEDNKMIDPLLSLGIIEADYNQMFDIWSRALQFEPETTFLDVQNGFKYSESFGILRSDPNDRPTNTLFSAGREVQDYQGVYDDDRIAILILQDKKAGELNEKFEFENTNGLRLSFRSQNTSTHAELLASLFNGGGHGGASGGTVIFPDVTLDSKLAVSIDGKVVYDPEIVYKELKNNYDIRHNYNMPEKDKLKDLKNIKIVQDDNGKKCSMLIRDLVGEIRFNQPKLRPMPKHLQTPQHEREHRFKEKRRAYGR